MFSILLGIIERLRGWAAQAGSRQEIATIPARLETLADSLKGICSDVEPVFLQLGRELVSVNADAEDLMHQTLQAVGLVGGESDQGVLVKVGSLATNSIEELKRCEIEVPENLNHVKMIVGSLENLNSMCGTIRRTAMMFGTIGLNVGVESSRSKESMALFAVVANELQQLSGKITAITENIQDKLKRTRSGQVTSYGKISEGLKRLKSLAGESEEALQDARNEIEQLIRLSLEALDLADVHSKEIFSQVGQVVMGIQFHDSMSQRIGHIAEALYDAERLCREKQYDTHNPNSKQKAFDMVHSMLQLQAAQLSQLVSDVDDAYATNVQAFEKIGGQIQKLIECLSTLGPEDGTQHLPSNKQLPEPVREKRPQAVVLKSEEEDPFIALHNVLRHLNMLVGQGRKMAQDLDNGADEASEAAAMISDCMEDVRSIGYESLLVALNAIVQAAHLDDKGRTLEVLAQEIKRLSDQLAEFVKNILKLLDAITASAAKLKARFPEEAKKTSAEGCCDMSLDDSIEEISRAYEQFKEYSSDASHRAEALQTVISQTKAELDFLPALAREIAAQHRLMEEIINDLNPWAGRDARYDQGEIKEIHTRYTMEQERTIHEQFLGRPGQSAAAHENDPDDDNDSGKDESLSAVYEQAPDEDTDKESFGENVELF